MKAILILDKMPESCLECEVLDNDELTCLGMKVEYGHLNNRQYFCPLKPMPKKLLILGHYQDNELLNSEEIAYAKGRNACIDEILGEDSK